MPPLPRKARLTVESTLRTLRYRFALPLSNKAIWAVEPLLHDSVFWAVTENNAALVRVVRDGDKHGALSAQLQDRLGAVVDVTELPDTSWEDHLVKEDRAVLTLIGPADTVDYASLGARLQSSQVRLAGFRFLDGPAHREPSLEYYFHADDGLKLLKSQIEPLAQQSGVDFTLLPAASKRRRRRLLAFDMDSTLIQCEVIDELAAEAGVGAEVAAVTARAMRGELDFQSSFRERMRQLAGLPESALVAVRDRLPMVDGVDRLFKELRAQGHFTVILSGGFDYFARHLQQRLGISEVHANTLELRDGALTGEVNGPIVDGERKLQLLQEIATREGFAIEDTVAVGDGANDLPMIGGAGLGVAFHAKPLVRERSPAAVSMAGLDALLAVLGEPG